MSIFIHSIFFRTYTLSGAYRNILGSLQNLQWKIMKYNDPNKSLIMSDFDILRKFEEPVDIPGQYFISLFTVSTLCRFYFKYKENIMNQRWK